MVGDPSPAIKAEATQPMRSLSGGNQQKVALGRWLERSGDLPACRRPDPGRRRARAACDSQALADFCAEGNALLVHSVDPEELVELCDRVLVMGEGRIVAELSGAELTSRELEAATRMCGRAPNASAA